MKFELLSFVILLIFTFVREQETTSDSSGVVMGSDGAIAGATITATHVPYDSVYTTISRKDERFDVCKC